jgi:hypothetical protein
MNIKSPPDLEPKVAIALIAGLTLVALACIAGTTVSMIFAPAGIW